jgi:hypothetical protein
MPLTKEKAAEAAVKTERNKTDGRNHYSEMKAKRQDNKKRKADSCVAEPSVALE